MISQGEINQIITTKPPAVTDGDEVTTQAADVAAPTTAPAAVDVEITTEEDSAEITTADDVVTTMAAEIETTAGKIEERVG